jgi:GNAT superfamily N-acetyltransferase
MTEILFLADRPEALPRIARWYFDAWGHTILNNSVEKTCERIREKLNRNKPPLTLIAVERERVVGAAQLKIGEMNIYPERRYWIGGVFVDPHVRGVGVGSALVMRLSDIARSMHIKKLHLQTEQLDGGLYTRLGWKAVEKVRYQGVYVLVMERYLLRRRSARVRPNDVIH